MRETSLPIPSREQVVNHQLQSLIGVAGAMAHIAGQNWSGESGTGSMDGGAKMAAEQTLIKACNRVDSILDRDNAWDMAGYDGLVTHLNNIYASHLALLKQQSDSVAAMDRPSRRYGPALVRLSPGKWIAVLGLLTDLDNAIVGIGACPEDALTEFDCAFRGDASKELSEWAKAYADAEAAGQPLPGYPPPNKTQNEILSPPVDTIGNKNSPNVSGTRKNIRRNRKILKPNGNGGKKEN